MADQQEASDKKPEKKRSPFTVVTLTGMLWLCAGFYAAVFVGGIIYDMFSRIGLVAGAFFVGAMVHAAITAPWAMRRQVSRRRKAITFAVVPLAVVCAVAWIYWPDSERWRPYTFDEELAGIEAKRAVPDEQNAALMYERLFPRVELEANEPDAFRQRDDSITSKPWRSAEHPDFAKWLDGYDDLVVEVMEISRVEACRFDVEGQVFADIGPKISRRSEAFMFCFRVLVASANRNIGEGSIKSGVEKYVCALRMAKHSLQRPTVLDFYRGFSMTSSALRAVWRFVVENEKGGELHLNLLAEAIDTPDRWASDWMDILAVEKLQMKNLYGGLYEVSANGKIRFTRQFTSIFGSNEELDKVDKYAQKMAALGLALFAPWSPEAVGAIVDDMYQPFARLADPDFNWDTLKEVEEEYSAESRRLHGARALFWLMQMDSSDISRFHRSYMRAVTLRRSSELMIGLRRHKNELGAWPESLDEIKSLAPTRAFIDPLNGGAFVYDVTEGGFKLYSKGPNGVDEGGRDGRPKPEDENAPDDVAIWPIPGKQDAGESTAALKVEHEALDSNEAGAHAE
jgi:hypothetical protein